MPAPLGDVERLVCHYTTASTALEHILTTMRLRLGPIADTNDPWEGRRPAGGMMRGVPFVPTGDDFPHFFFEARNEMDRVLNLARVACLCRNEALSSSRSIGLSRMAWARDRMWAQYADRHRGVCLLFDRDELIASFQKALGDQGGCLAEDVTYSDADPLPVPDLDAFMQSPTEYPLGYRNLHARPLYFMKREDWSGEREFRVAALVKQAKDPFAFVPIKGPLKSLIVGHRFPRAYRPSVLESCKRAGIRPFAFSYSPEPRIHDY